MSTLVADYDLCFDSGSVTYQGGAASAQDVLEDGIGWAQLNPLASIEFTGTVSVPVGGVAYAARITGQASCNVIPNPVSINKVGSDGLSGTQPQSLTLSTPVAIDWSPTLDAGGEAGDLTARLTNSSLSYSMNVYAMAIEIDYNRSPTAPSSLSPTSGSTTTTLIPTFAGSNNDADGASTMEAVEIEVRNSDNALFWASGMLSDTGSTFSKPYAGTALVEGTIYKWRARTRDDSGASNAVGAWSSYLTFTANQNETPTALQTSPVHDAQVSSLTPSFVIGFSDPDVGDQFNAYQIQVRRNSDLVSFWDSGQVATTAGQKTAGNATVVYGGTALVNGTEYEWRVRVQDLYSTWSAYTSYLDFTPQLAPGAPTSLVPSGLQNTLTPTVSGTFVQGSGGLEDFFQYQVRQSGITIYSSGDITTNIATGQAYGTNNPSDTPSTPPALAWGTAYEIRARSKDVAGAYGDWTAWQAFNTNAAPTTPTGITPSNGQITPDTTPAIAWTHNDPDGDAQTQADIELYDVTTAAYVAAYNPKTLTQSTLTHDVTPALTLNRTYRLRIRTKGLAGPGFGTWSSPLDFTVATSPVLTVTEPDPSDVLTSSALLVEWTFSGGSGTQQDYRVVIYADDGSTIVYDTGMVAGTALSHAVPAGTLLNNSTYYVQVSVHDTLAQLGQSGQIIFSVALTAPATVTGLALQVVGDQADG